MNKYNYQYNVAKQAVESKSSKVVIALAPSAGKTTISHHIANMLKGKKVLFIAHGQTLLKNQYLEELKKPNVEINFTWGTLNANVDLEVMIMQNVDQIIKTYDVVIVDEAHQFYGTNTYNKIIAKVRPSKQILMTGSPAKFNGKKEYDIISISPELLAKRGVYSELEIDLLKVNSEDFQHQLMAIQSCLNKLKKDKILIMAPSVEYAKKLCAGLKNRKVGVSTSSDSQNEVIKAYINGELDTLVVVNKGVLGFNDPNTTVAIDLKGSYNLEATFQFLARVLRKKDNCVKKYIRMTLVQDVKKQYDFIKLLKSTFKQPIFGKYTDNKFKA